MFTKGLTRPAFEYLRAKIMGWWWFVRFIPLDLREGVLLGYCVIHSLGLYFMSNMDDLAILAYLGATCARYLQNEYSQVLANYWLHTFWYWRIFWLHASRYELTYSTWRYGIPNLTYQKVSYFCSTTAQNKEVILSVVHCVILVTVCVSGARSTTQRSVWWPLHNSL